VRQGGLGKGRLDAGEKEETLLFIEECGRHSLPRRWGGKKDLDKSEKNREKKKEAIRRLGGGDLNEKGQKLLTKRDHKERWESSVE